MPTPTLPVISESIAIVDAVDSQQPNRHRRTYSIVEEWHRTSGHPGLMEHCDQQPCHAVAYGSRDSRGWQ